MSTIGRFVSFLALGAAILGSTLAAPGGARAPSLNGLIAFTSAGPNYQEIYRVDAATGRRTDLTKRRSSNGALRPQEEF